MAQNVLQESVCCYNVVTYAVAHYTHTCMLCLPILLEVYNKGMESCLTVVPVISLSCILDNKTILFSEVHDDYGFFWSEVFLSS